MWCAIDVFGAEGLLLLSLSVLVSPIRALVAESESHSTLSA